MELLSYVNKFTISDVLVTPTRGQRLIDERPFTYQTYERPFSVPIRNENIYNGDRVSGLIIDDRDYILTTPASISLPQAVDLMTLDTVPSDRMATMTAISQPIRNTLSLSDSMIAEIGQTVRDALRDAFREGSFITDVNTNTRERTINATIQMPSIIERIETTISLTPSGED